MANINKITKKKGLINNMIYNKRNIKIVYMVILAMLLQVFIPMGSNYNFAEGGTTDKARFTDVEFLIDGESFDGNAINTEPISQDQELKLIFDYEIDDSRDGMMSGAAIEISIPDG